MTWIFGHPGWPNIGTLIGVETVTQGGHVAAVTNGRFKNTGVSDVIGCPDPPSPLGVGMLWLELVMRSGTSDG